MPSELQKQKEITDRSSSEASLDLKRVRELVRTAQQGDDSSFSQLIQIFAPKLQSMIYRMILDWDETRDVSQEAFIQAYRALKRFDPETNFQAWLFTIGARKAFDFLRRRKRNLITPGYDPNQGENEPVKEDLSVLQNETDQEIEKAMSDLPYEQRVAFTLSVFQNSSTREIADILEVSLKSAEMHIYRARIFLKERLKALLP
jgi:RNA polymerase sigma-70 factor (ECF subfamily)